jgi:hypothetical protein
LDALLKEKPTVTTEIDGAVDLLEVAKEKPSVGCGERISDTGGQSVVIFNQSS